MKFSEVVQQRRSVKSYQPDTAISDDELTVIFDEVVLSPSSFNLQHWQFIVQRDSGRKEKLKEIAWGQPQVGDCSAAILVCGRLDAWKDAAEIYKDAPESVQQSVVPMIENLYRDNEQLCRDEAIRSASLAAMTLMYSAANRGYVSGPMIGFDQAAAATVCELPETTIPVMLVVLGKQLNEPRPRDNRRPLSDVVRLESHAGKGL